MIALIALLGMSSLLAYLCYREWCGTEFPKMQKETPEEQFERFSEDAW